MTVAGIHGRANNNNKMRTYEYIFVVVTRKLQLHLFHANTEGNSFRGSSTPTLPSYTHRSAPLLPSLSRIYRNR